MRRTQVYLAEQAHASAMKLAREQERTLSDVIRAALDGYLAVELSRADRLRRMRLARGMWKDRTDLPDFDEVRRSWDRDVWGTVAG